MLRDHTRLADYRSESIFLPELNNEVPHELAEQQRERFQGLNHVTLVKFLWDPTIYPIESEWFGEINEEGRIIPMEETDIYINNRFGLRHLDEQGRIEKKEIEGYHLHFRDEHIKEIFAVALLK